MADEWKIEVTRSGGFAGITRRAALDSRELVDADASRLATLAGAVDFARYARQTPRPGRPDAFQYHLQISHGPAHHDIVVGEHEADPALRALLSWLLARAQGPGTTATP